MKKSILSEIREAYFLETIITQVHCYNISEFIEN